MTETITGISLRKFRFVYGALLFFSCVAAALGEETLLLLSIAQAPTSHHTATSAAITVHSSAALKNDFV